MYFNIARLNLNCTLKISDRPDQFYPQKSEQKSKESRKPKMFISSFKKKTECFTIFSTLIKGYY